MRFIILFLIFACAEGNKIFYHEARNYFIKNNFETKKVVAVVLSTRAAFDAIAQPAAFMGAKGRPTSIDFEHQSVIALIGDVSNKNPSFEITKLTQNKSEIVLTYKIKQEAPQSYFIRPAKFLILDKKNISTVRLEVE